MQLNAEIAEYNDARERELPLVQDVDGKVKELRQRIGDLNNHQMSQRATYRKLKEMSTEMDGEVSKDVECWFFVDSANNLETDMLWHWFILFFGLGYIKLNDNNKELYRVCM